MRVYDASLPVPPSLIAPGSPYEVETRPFLGRDYPMLRNAPRTLNAFLEGAVVWLRRIAGDRMTVQDGIVTLFTKFEVRAAVH